MTRLIVRHHINKRLKQKTVKYTCPTHPEVVQDHPGNCPKCGMKLVEKKDLQAKDVLHSKDTTKIKNVNKKMMHDSTNINKDHTIPDTILSRKHIHKVM